MSDPPTDNVWAEQARVDSAGPGSVGAPSGVLPAKPQIPQELLRSPINRLLDRASLIPGVGGLAAAVASDAKTYADDPKSRTWGNYLLTAASVLPFGKQLHELPLSHLQNIEKQLGDAYVAGAMKFDEWVEKSEPIRSARVAKELATQKEAAKGVIKPVYKDLREIPHGTKIKTFQYATEAVLGTGEKEMANVVDTYAIQLHDGLYYLPVVEFANGRRRKLTPSDLKDAADVFMPTEVKP